MLFRNESWGLRGGYCIVPNISVSANCPRAIGSMSSEQRDRVITWGSPNAPGYEPSISGKNGVLNIEGISSEKGRGGYVRIQELVLKWLMNTMTYEQKVSKLWGGRSTWIIINCYSNRADLIYHISFIFPLYMASILETIFSDLSVMEV